MEGPPLSTWSTESLTICLYRQFFTSERTLNLIVVSLIENNGSLLNRNCPKSINVLLLLVFTIKFVQLNQLNYLQQFSFENFQPIDGFFRIIICVVSSHWECEGLKLLEKSKSVDLSRKSNLPKSGLNRLYYSWRLLHMVIAEYIPCILSIKGCQWKNTSCSAFPRNANWFFNENFSWISSNEGLTRLCYILRCLYRKKYLRQCTLLKSPFKSIMSRNQKSNGTDARGKSSKWKRTGSSFSFAFLGLLEKLIMKHCSWAKRQKVYRS